MFKFILLKQLFFLLVTILVICIQAIIPFVKPAFLSLFIALTGYMAGMLFGTLLGLMLASQYRLIWFFPYLGTAIIRGTPLLVQILFVYYGLPQFGWSFSALWATIFAISCNSCAYVAHMVHKGIQAIPDGQLEAAHSLGFSWFQTILYIILPQAYLTMAPDLTNECLTLIKDSSLASAIGVHEITQEAQHIFSTTYDATNPLFTAAIMYLLLTCSFRFLLAQVRKYYYVPR